MEIMKTKVHFYNFFVTLKMLEYSRVPIVKFITHKLADETLLNALPNFVYGSLKDSLKMWTQAQKW